MSGFVVVLDANVLYGIEVTDLLATMATRRLFRPHWSRRSSTRWRGTSPAGTTSIRLPSTVASATWTKRSRTPAGASHPN